MNKNKTALLHAPDFEDANFIEEDYMDPEIRKDYENEVKSNIKEHWSHSKDNQGAKLSEQEKKDQEKDLEEKTNDIVNYATILL
jgi:hypothetical protein